MNKLLHLKDISITPTNNLTFIESCDRIYLIRKQRITPKIKAKKPKSLAKEINTFTKLLRKLKPDITEAEILQLFNKGKEK